MKLFAPLILGVMVLMGSMAHAVPLKVLFQDVKLPTQRVLERQVFSLPIASNTTYIKSAAAGATSAAVATLSSFTHQPDVARNLEITPNGTTGDIESCVVTVSGTDINNHPISEPFTFLADATGKKTGNKAFKTVSSVSWAASCESGGYAATWDIGVGEKLGLKRCMDNAGDIGWSVYNGTKEATAPTMASNVSIVASNTADFVGTMDGAKSFILYYVQNYKCF